tara:strand:+ start:824 stop:1006 length:183 start_codon:yes stop_codon:yes gene_type:complete
MINSPCKKICKIDLSNGLCIGCNRNINEIKNWIKLDDNQKERLIEKLNLRKQRKITQIGK